MAIRTVSYHASPTGVEPSAAQYAGVAGEQNATCVEIGLSDELISALAQTGAVYRFEYIDGMTQYDSTENFTPDGSSSVFIGLPNGWTSAGGTAELRLVIAQLDSDSNETVVLYSLPCNLYFSARGTGQGFTEKSLTKGLTSLISDAQHAINQANSSADLAALAADSVILAESAALNATDLANAAANTAKNAAINANAAASNANLVVEQVDLHVGTAQGFAEDAQSYAEQALRNILNGVNAHNNDSSAHPSIQSDIRAVEAIARGKATARVFDTHDDMAAWLAVPENVETLSIGDNLYIREIDVKDYWWDGAVPQVLEAEAPDLTDYYTKAEIDGMMPIYKTRTQYDDLYNQGLILAGRVYFINEGV